MANKDQAKAGPITIKKYANRRLYNTATSSYVTLDHLCQMVKDGTEFVVYDAKTGEDITRSVLTHIIVEEESKGQTLLPISFLRQLIGLYGDNMQWMVPRYLDYSMEMFARNQEQLRSYFHHAMSGMFPFAALDEMSKQNAAVFERAMQMFSPFPVGSGDSGAKSGGDKATKPAAKPAEDKTAKADKADSADKPPPATTGSAEIDRSLATLQQNMDAFRDRLQEIKDETAATEIKAKAAGKAAEASSPSTGRKTGARATAAGK